MHENDPKDLKEKDLRRELEVLEETWTETLLYGSDEALEEHTARTQELQEEYERRHSVDQADEGQPAGAESDPSR
jgi:hypothetical protein